MQGPVLRLCHGVARIHGASCDELTSAPFLEGIINEVGLVPDPRRDWLYGAASAHMVCQPGTSGCASYGKVGLWQEPLQISKALVHIARSPTIWPVRRYVEVGVWTAWTCVLVSAYLSRVGASDGSFQGAAVDISHQQITPQARVLLQQHNVTYVPRHKLPDWLAAQRWAEQAAADAIDAGRRRHTASAPAATRRAHAAAAAAAAAAATPYIDLCFIDANHSYAAVREDYESFAPRCRSMMFHDIQDATNLHFHREKKAGGVPSFWHQLVSSVHASRAAAFTEQHSVAGPMFGIGVLSPNDRGTAEPDDQAAWLAWGDGLEAWNHLCLRAKHLCARTKMPSG